MKRPRVRLNVAVSLDGRIALAGGRRHLLSDREDHKRVHRMRADHDAILVGIGTVLADDPALTVKKDWVESPRNPLRVIIDSRCRTPSGARVLDATAPSRIYHTQPEPPASERAGADAEAVDWVRVCAGPQGGVDLHAVLADLGKQGVESLMVEGGSRVIASFLAAGLVDEASVFIAPVVLGEGAPPMAAAPAQGDHPLADFQVLDAQHRESGVLLELAPKRST